MLEHGELPDPVGQTLANLNERLALVEAEVKMPASREPDIPTTLPTG